MTTGMLTEAQIAEFRSEGVLKFDFAGLIGQSAFQKLQAAFLDADRRNFVFQDDPGWHAERMPIKRHTSLRDHYPEIAAVACSPVVGATVAQLAGSAHMRLWMDETFIKEPGTGGTYWHQDLPYQPMERRGYLTLWVAIEDVEEDMAPVQYVPRSHRLGSLGRRVSYDQTRPPGAREVMPEGFRHLLREDDYSVVGEPVSWTLRAGEAVAHDGMTLHGSKPNSSGKTRRAWAIVYFPADTQYTGMPRKETDGLGLEIFKTFDHPNFPLVA